MKAPFDSACVRLGLVAGVRGSLDLIRYAGFNLWLWAFWANYPRAATCQKIIVEAEGTVNE